jgi:capsular polysaccharide biosynthesis protein
MTAEVPGFVPIDAPLQEITAEPQPSSNYVGPFVSLRVVLAALRRRRRFWVAVAMVGLIAGMAVTVVIPRNYTAMATLVLAHNPNDDPTLDMATDAALLETAAVAQQVINRLGLHVTATKLMGQYTDVAVSDAVLQINVTGPTPQEAIRRARALVASFLSVRTTILESQNLAAVRVLQGQVSGIQRQETSLRQQIRAGGSLAGESSSPLVAAIAQDITQVAQLEQTIATDNLNTIQVIRGTQVLVNGILIPHSAKKRLAVDGASGLVAGLALGIGIVAAQTIISDRIRRRDEFAAALRAPVSLSVGKIRRPWWMRVRRLRRRLKRPNQSVRRLARCLRSELAPAAPGYQGLAVVSIDSIEASVLAVAESARALCAEGKRVIVVDLSHGGLLGRVLGPRHSGTHETSIADTRLPAVVVVPPDADEAFAATSLLALPPPGQTGTLPSTRIVLVLAELDPAVGAHYLGDLVSKAVVVGTTGRSSTSKVRANAEMLGVAGITVASGMLVAADHNDESVGEIRNQRWGAHYQPKDKQPGSVSTSGES